jgi:hypothetical protein
MPCILADGYQSLGGTCCLYLSGMSSALKMEAEVSSGTLVTNYQSILCYNPKGDKLSYFCISILKINFRD